MFNCNPGRCKSNVRARFVVRAAIYSLIMFLQSLIQCARLCAYNISAVTLIAGLIVLPELVLCSKSSCPLGYFRNATSIPVRCSPCSSCPINHIVRKPCNRQNDTVCGPFYEFEFFNQKQMRTSNPYVIDHREKLDDRKGKGAMFNKGQNYGESTTSISQEETITVRCGQPQWRILCYGLVAALVVIVSVALAAVALISYFRANGKTIRLFETSGITRSAVDDDDNPSASSSTMTTTIVVDRDVRHLEEQLIHNQRRRAFLRWLFGSTSAADRLFNSNDYLDERHRRRFLLMLDGSVTNRGQRSDVHALQPYPGMISTGGIGHYSHVQSESNEDIVAEDESNNQTDLLPSTTSSRPEEGQTESDQSISVGESSLLLPQESNKYSEEN